MDVPAHTHNENLKPQSHQIMQLPNENSKPFSTSAKLNLQFEFKPCTSLLWCLFSNCIGTHACSDFTLNATQEISGLFLSQSSVQHICNHTERHFVRQYAIIHFEVLISSHFLLLSSHLLRLSLSIYDKEISGQSKLV